MKTPQRNTILAYLKDNTSHPTARDIYDALSKKEMISMATVYNTLALMKKRGLVRELAITNFDHKKYDPNTKPHAHLICSNCGEIADLHFPLHIGIPHEHRQGFTIKDSEVNFYGLCSVCNNKDKKPASQSRSPKTTKTFTEKTGSRAKA
jgi:Fur family transcriptional regulator, peroxide stress response regulator